MAVGYSHYLFKKLIDNHTEAQKNKIAQLLQRQQYLNSSLLIGDKQQSYHYGKRMSDAQPFHYSQIQSSYNQSSFYRIAAAGIHSQQQQQLNDTQNYGRSLTQKVQNNMLLVPPKSAVSQERIRQMSSQSQIQEQMTSVGSRSSSVADTKQSSILGLRQPSIQTFAANAQPQSSSMGEDQVIQEHAEDGEDHKEQVVKARHLSRPQLSLEMMEEALSVDERGDDTPAIDAEMPSCSLDSGKVKQEGGPNGDGAERSLPPTPQANALETHHIQIELGIKTDED
ncbi:hypothetical protein FGO68_gene15973 [Halteria grandinella]|uniref:Uncharacterized protein n=1 Tax=Halteria grandinella TaxID=5974 RepID=A0A8J8P0V0_HALGN|nr:hypothetical protein FGO68_gene15973 [Halteria grandinella]